MVRRMIPVAAGLVIILGSIELVTIVADAAYSQETDKTKNALPDGVVARLGSPLLKPPGCATFVDISDDGKQVVSSSGALIDGQWRSILCFWDGATGRRLRTVKMATPFYGPKFSPDGRRLAGYTWKTTAGNIDVTNIALLDIATEILVWQKRIPGRLRQMRFSASGDRLIAIAITAKKNDLTSTVHVWATNTGQKLTRWTFLHHKQYRQIRKQGTYAFLGGVDISPDGHQLLLSTTSAELQPVASRVGYKLLSANRFLEVLDIRRKKSLRRDPVPKDAWTPQFDQNGHMAATFLGKELWLYDVASGHKRMLVKDSLSSGDVLFLPNGKLLVKNGPVLVMYRLSDGKTILHTRLPAWIVHGTFTPDGAAFAVTTGSAVRVWDVVRQKMRIDVPGHLTSVRQVHFRSPDTLVSKDQWGSWCVWDLKTGKSKQRFHVPDWWRNKEGAVTGSLHNGLYLHQTKKGFLQLHRADGGTIVESYPKNLWGKGGLHEFSVDGTTQVSISKEDHQLSARFFDLPSGKKRAHFRGEASVDNLEEMRAPSLSADGKLFAFKTTDNRPAVVDARTGKLLRVFGKAIPDSTSWWPLQFAVAFSPDNRLLANLIFPRDPKQNPVQLSMQIWDVQTGQELQRFPIVRVAKFNYSEIPRFAFSPDNRILAYTEAHENFVTLYEVASGTPRGRLQAPFKNPTSLAFSPRGRRLATGYFDTGIDLWDLRRPLPGHRPQKLITAKQLQTAWQAVRQRDAAKADAVLWSMIQSPKATLAFFEKHFKPKQTPSAQQLNKWLADLDSGRFAIRTKAMQRLGQLHTVGVPFLQKALKHNPTLEVHQRLQILLKQARQPNRDLQLVQEQRALEVLERIGTPAARRLLQRLAKGNLLYRTTQEAAVCLSRLQQD